MTSNRTGLVGAIQSKEFWDSPYYKRLQKQLYKRLYSFVYSIVFLGARMNASHERSILYCKNHEHCKSAQGCGENRVRFSDHSEDSRKPSHKVPPFATDSVSGDQLQKLQDRSQTNNQNGAASNVLTTTSS